MRRKFEDRFSKGNAFLVYSMLFSALFRIHQSISPSLFSLMSNHLSGLFVFSSGRNDSVSINYRLTMRSKRGEERENEKRRSRDSESTTHTHKFLHTLFSLFLFSLKLS